MTAAGPRLEASLDCKSQSLGSSGRSQTLNQSASMHLDGFFRQPQLFANLAITQTSGHQPKNLLLLWRELLDPLYSASAGSFRVVAVDLHLAANKISQFASIVKHRRDHYRVQKLAAILTVVNQLNNLWRCRSDGRPE